MKRYLSLNKLQKFLLFHNKPLFIIVSGRNGEFKSTLVLQLVLQLLNSNKRWITIYAWYKDLPWEKFNDKVISELLDRIFTIKLKSYEELQYFINSLPYFLMVNRTGIKRVGIVVIDDYMNLYFSSPLSSHERAGMIMLAENISVLRKIVLENNVYVFLINHLSRRGKPVYWKIFSYYCDFFFEIEREYDTIKLSILDNEFNEVERIELEEINGLLYEVEEENE